MQAHPALPVRVALESPVDVIEATAAAQTSVPTRISRDMLARLDVAGPRYTSYPTADRFVEAFGAEQYEQALVQRAEGGGAVGGAFTPLSIYVHVPFCESVCYYCA